VGRGGAEGRGRAGGAGKCMREGDGERECSAKMPSAGEGIQNQTVGSLFSHCLSIFRYTIRFN